MSGERVKLTVEARKALGAIVDRGPSCFRSTSRGMQPAYVSQLVEAGFIERLNRMAPGPVIYEITKAGRAALAGDRS